jgi:hypothetical protein
MPATWQAHSRQVFGEVLPKTAEREYLVAVRMIEKWLNEGHNEGAVMRIWNQGNAGACVRGINRHGVAYDSCAYEQKVTAIYRQKLAMR